MSHQDKANRYSEEFKHQMVDLFNAGKPPGEICAEYQISPSALLKWRKRINATGSSKLADNRTAEETRLIVLEKENKQLRMENDILKQAALIFARRS